MQQQLKVQDFGGGLRCGRCGVSPPQIQQLTHTHRTCPALSALLPPTIASPSLSLSTHAPPGDGPCPAAVVLGTVRVEGGMADVHQASLLKQQWAQEHPPYLPHPLCLAYSIPPSLTCPPPSLSAPVPPHPSLLVDRGVGEALHTCPSLSAPLTPMPPSPACVHLALLQLKPKIMVAAGALSCCHHNLRVQLEQGQRDTRCTTLRVDQVQKVCQEVDCQ